MQYLDELFTEITTTQARTAEESKMSYDRIRNTRGIKIDDNVYLLKEPKPSKFDCNWLGSYKISRVLDDLNVKLILGINKYNKYILIS